MAEDPGGRFERFSGGPDPSPAPTETPAPAAEWLERLPEQYRENPLSYFDYVAEQERLAKEADQWKQFGTQAQTWIDWARPYVDDMGQRRSRGPEIPSAQDPHATRDRWQAPPAPFENADWDDPATLPRVLQQMWETLVRQHEDSFNRHAMTREEIQQHVQGMQQLLGNYDRVNRVEQEAFYAHTGYQPVVTRDRVVEYMQAHPGVDAGDAYKALTEADRITAARQAGIEEGRREAERAAASQQTTSETTRGTPPRRPAVQPNAHRGYGTRPQALWDHVAERTGRRDW